LPPEAPDAATALGGAAAAAAVERIALTPDDLEVVTVV